MQRHLQRAFGSQHHRFNRAGGEALHIGGTPAIVARIFFGQRERWHRPSLTFHRNHIGMTRQHHPRHALRPDGGVEIGFAA